MFNSDITRRYFLQITGASLASLLINHKSAHASNNIILPVLMYHDISYDSHDLYAAMPTMFAAQMEWLYANGYQAISFADIDRLARGEIQKPIMITFDDGYASFSSYAFPYMQRYNFKAVINAIGEYVGSFITLGKSRPTLSWDEYRYLTGTGLVEVGCHTYALHKYGFQEKQSEFDDQLPGDLAKFQEKYTQELGKPATTIAWPYGFYTAKSLDIARQAGFRHILGSENGFASLPVQSANEISLLKSKLSVIPRIAILERFKISLFSRMLQEAK